MVPLLTACLLGAAVGVPARAQLPPLEDGRGDGASTTSTTTTTAPPAPPSGPQHTDPSPDGPAPEGGGPGPDGSQGHGDGEPAPAPRGQVPPEAQRIIDSVPRSGPSSSARLVGALAELEALGVPRTEAMRVGMGRFPIAGTATYVHDWLFPRWGPGFRFHLGTDLFAPMGTPIRAPVDGIATTRTQALGGLTVRVTMPDGTFFYLAHLSGLVDGFVDGMAVRTGDIVGYVGDSGNARGGAPHLHIGIYPRAGPPVDPKPILDQFLTEAEARLPEVIQAYRDAGYGAEQAGSVQPPEPPSWLAAPPSTPEPAPVPEEVDGLPTGVLFVAGASPAGGALSLLEAEVADLATSIDWSQRTRTRSGAGSLFVR
jgi:murein DD-endopeptidase MepM/ murein hydrolase activator NlpD